MELTVSQLTALVGGQADSGASDSLRVTGIASVEEAGVGDATFYGNSKYLPQLKASKASVALVPVDFKEQVDAVCVRVDNPTAAFAKLIEHFAAPVPTFAPGIHPTAVIGKKVKLGDKVSIQPYVVIEDGAEIGEGTVLGAHTYIGYDAKVGANCLVHPRVTIGYRCLLGNRVIMHSGSVLGADGFGFEFQQGKHVKLPQVGIVQIDDDVEIGANTSIDRARFGKTWIGEGTKIDNQVQIGHNVRIGKHCIICGLVGISGSVKIGNYVTFAGQVGVNGHIEIGDKIIFGGKSGVNKSVKESGMYLGNPILPARQFHRQTVNIQGLKELKDKVAKMAQILEEK